MHAVLCLAHTFPTSLLEWMSCIFEETRLAASLRRLVLNVSAAMRPPGSLRVDL